MSTADGGAGATAAAAGAAFVPGAMAPLPPGRQLLRAFFDLHARRYLPVYGIGLVFLIATNWLTVAIPGLVKNVFDAMQTRGGVGVDRLALWIVVCSVAVIVVRTLSRVLFFNPGRTIEFRIRNQLLERLLAKGGTWFRAVAHGDLVSRATNDSTFVRALVGFSVLQLLNLVLAAAMALFHMLATDALLTLLCLLPMSASLLVLRQGTGRMFQAMRDGQVELGALSDHILESYKGKAAIALGHAEPAFLALFDRHNRRYTEINVDVAALRCFVLPLAGQTGSVAIFILLFVGGARVAEGTLTIGDLAAFASYVGVLVASLVMAGWLIASLQRGMVALERVWEVLDLPADRVPGEALPAHDRGLHVQARGLTHRFADAAPDEPATLQDVSFEVAPGGVLGVFGAVGSGKTTLVALLSGELEPPRGTLTLDGVDAAAVDPGSRASAVAVVPQVAFLFSRPLRDNVAFVDRPEAIDDARVAAALQAAQLAEEVARMPAGVATLVGERGQMLSGGQRQRAQLARALYRPSRLLLLDDVLASVDHDTEERLLAAISAHRKAQRDASGRPATTLVIVSSRLSALRDADEILVLEGGRVVERGDHASLLAQGGRYAAADAAQRDGESEAGSATAPAQDAIGPVGAAGRPVHGAEAGGSA